MPCAQCRGLRSQRLAVLRACPACRNESPCEALVGGVPGGAPDTSMMPLALSNQNAKCHGQQTGPLPTQLRSAHLCHLAFAAPLCTLKPVHPVTSGCQHLGLRHCFSTPWWLPWAPMRWIQQLTPVHCGCATTMQPCCHWHCLHDTRFR